MSYKRGTASAFFGIVVVLALAFTALDVGCTANQRARGYGGTESIKLTQGQKLVTVTWKEADLWILTRTMREDEQPENYKFQEKSSFGILEGTVNIEEVK